MAGPAGNERNTVTAFPKVALAAAKWAHASVSIFFQSVVSARPNFDDLRAVVARENDQCVFRQAGALKCVEHLADDGVGLDDKIPKFTRATFAAEFRVRHDGIVG